MVRECLTRMQQVVELHQQRAYMLFKMWPSLIIGAILRDIEMAPQFLTTITEDIPIELKATAFYIHETGTICSPTHAMLCLEVADMWKTLGHPIVNMNMSSHYWMTKGMVMKRNLGPAAEAISNIFKKEFCRQYYKVHKKWPNVLPFHGLNPHIKSCMYANKWGETATFKWDPEDFSRITLSKNIEFNYHVDTIDIVADKAIIPRRSEWVHEYDSKAFRTLHGHFPKGPPLLPRVW